MTFKNKGKMLLAAILIIAGTLLCMNTVTAYRYFTDWNFGVVMPAFMGICCWLYSLKLIFIDGPLIKNQGLRTAVILAAVAFLLFFAVVEILIITDPIIHDSDNAGEVDTVIVLGCGIWPDGRPTQSLSSRLDRALSYYEENPHVNIIVSGGQGPNEPFPEALTMKKYLIDRGVSEEKIIVEDKSTSTRENFEFSRALMDEPGNEIIKVVFVTNEFHVFRSRILAKRFGFDAYALSAPTPRVVLFNSYLREFFAFVKSMLVDY
ncbi:MAG: YdcF family protein [Clostridiaceae bacterium]|nr:YdcF family protein [Clostridiaceae bacterium]